MNTDNKKINETENSKLIKALKSALDNIDQIGPQRLSPTLVPLEELKHFIRQERKKQKVSRNTLAKLAAVSIGTVMGLEQGKQTISLNNLQKILNALGKKIWVE